MDCPFHFTVSYLDAFITPMLELDRREARLLFHKNGCHTAIRFLCSFVIAISVRNQGRELQRNTELAFTSSGDDLVASEFRFKASEQGFRFVYINLVNGSLHKQFFFDKILASFYYSCG